MARRYVDQPSRNDGAKPTKSITEMIKQMQAEDQTADPQSSVTTEETEKEAKK